ncbi:MAG: 7TM diverse intracellular signaling domain-containing protein [Pseudomonadota bacterium]
MPPDVKLGFSLFALNLWRFLSPRLWCRLAGAGLLFAACSGLPAWGAVAVAIPAQLQVIPGLGADATVEQLAALPANGFQPFVPTRLYKVGPDTPLWLKLRIPALPVVAGNDWLLEFPTVIVDRYEFYRQDATGGWQMQAAGDRVAHNRWPLDSLRPRFVLPAYTGSGEDVFIRVVHQLPVNLQPVIVSADAAERRDGMEMLWTGLLAGVVLALVVSCVQMTLAYRDRIYGWYAAYLVFTMMAALCYSGVAQRSLWPEATKFASDAIVYFVLAALAFNLEFSRAMFGGFLGRRLRFASRVLIALSVAYCVMALMSQRYDRHVVWFYVLALAIFSFTIFTAIRAWRRGVNFGGFWLLVYVPYLGSIALTLAHNGGIINAPWLPTDTPVAAAIIEAIAMMLCINAYGRLRHAQAVRDHVAARYDPLTGFFNLPEFRSTATRVWHAFARSRQDVAVIYATVEQVTGDTQRPVGIEAVMARSVRHVRTITRDVDIVGRVDANRIGIVVTGAPSQEVLSARLARLVALGLMQDADDAAVPVLRFRMVVGMRRSFTGSFSALESALHAQLDADEAARRTIPIRFLDTGIPVQRVNSR